MFSLERMLIFRFLFASRTPGIFSPRSRLSFLVMAVAICLLVVVLSVFNGFQVQMKKAIWSHAPHILIYPQDDNTISKPDLLIERILSLTTIEGKPLRNNIAKINKAIHSPGLLAYSEEFEPIQIRSVPIHSDLSSTSLDQYKIDLPLYRYDIDLISQMAKKKLVIIGEELAKYMGLTIGDRITLFAPKGAVAKKGVEFNKGQFTIAGTFKTNFYETDFSVVHIPYQTGKTFFALKGPTVIEIQLKDPDKLYPALFALTRNLKEYRFEDIESLNRNLFAALTLEKTLISLILFLFIVLAALGMIAAIYSQVKSYKKSIGILKAMGMSNRSLLVVFTANGLILGFLATIIGGWIGIYLAHHLEGIIGWLEIWINEIGSAVRGIYWVPVKLIPKDIYYFDHLPVSIDLFLVLLVSFSATVLSGIAGYIPARYAAMIDPIEAIRKEND